MNYHTATTTMNTNKKNKSVEMLEQYAKEYLIFVDTCVLLHSNYPYFMKRIEPYLQKYNNYLIIPKCVLDELERVIQKKPKLRSAAHKAMQWVARFAEKNLVKVKWDKNDGSVADNVFLTQFTKLRMTRHLMLITNDVDLAANIEPLGKCSSVQGIKKIRVVKINQCGWLEPLGMNSSKSSGSSRRNPNSEKSVTNVPAFAMGTKVFVGKGELLPVTHKAETGSKLTARVNGRSWLLTLGNHLSAGGEGDIYEVGGNEVAKIYMPACNTSMKRDKLQLMLSRAVSHPGVCFPKAMLYNDREEFVGYLMTRAKGYPLQYLLCNRAFLQQHFPQWKKIDLVKLCLTILKKIDFLHKMNIILGDINPNNILVASSSEVYFVDTDSYQVENYPCPVGTALFTAPEIMGRNYADFLRSMGNERFAVATLLFLIMMMGKSPYAKQDGGSLQDNILKGEFSFPLGDKSNHQAPEGNWRYIWSHLSRPLKEAFYNTFHREGIYHEEKNRLKEEKWMRCFSNYLHGLEHGMLDRDSMSGELFPTRFKNSDFVSKTPVPSMTGSSEKTCGAVSSASQIKMQTVFSKPRYTAPVYKKESTVWEKIGNWVSEFF